MGTGEKRKFNPEKFFSRNVVICIGSLFCCVLWGTTAPLIKTCYTLFGLDTDNPGSLILFAGLRFVLAGILIIAVTSAIRRKFVYPKARNWWRVGVFSLFETIAHYIFYYIGLPNDNPVYSFAYFATTNKDRSNPVLFHVLFSCCRLPHARRELQMALSKIIPLPAPDYPAPS